jgi:hypothetical protein
MSTPLRELITRLAVDSASQADFAADPAGFLAEHGWSELDGQDVSTALGALADESPIDQAIRLGDVVAGADGLDGGLDGAITALGAAAAVLAEAPVPPNGDSDAVELADPDLTLDRQDAADQDLDRDPSLGIDEGDVDGEHGERDEDEEGGEDGEPIDLDEDVAGGPDGPDRLDVSDEELDTSTFRRPDDYEDDAEEAAEPAAGGETGPDAELDDAPGVALAAPADGIGQGTDHESFADRDGDGDAVDIPEPEDDDDL